MLAVSTNIKKICHVEKYPSENFKSNFQINWLPRFFKLLCGNNCGLFYSAEGCLWNPVSWWVLTIRARRNISWCSVGVPAAQRVFWFSRIKGNHFCAGGNWFSQESLCRAFGRNKSSSARLKGEFAATRGKDIRQRLREIVDWALTNRKFESSQIFDLFKTRAPICDTREI